MNKITFGVLVLVCIFLIMGSNGSLGSIDIHEFNLLGDTKQQKIIVFRDDDLGPGWSVDSAIYITDLFRSRNVSHVLGVVPANLYGKKLSDDAVLYEYLKSIKDDDSIEFALHGYDHSYHEFEDIQLDGSPDSAVSKISAGIKSIEDITGITPVTFIPPYGVYNENTRIALKDTDSLHIISACQTDIKEDKAFKEVDGLLYLPVMMYFYNWDEKRDNTYDEIISSCNHAFDEYDICVIVFHHHMFRDDSGNMDPAKVQVLIDVIDWAKAEEEDERARIMLMKDISREDLQ